MGIFNDAGDAFNEVTDTIGDGAADVVSEAEEAANQVRDGAEQLVSDAGDVFNQYTDTIEDASEFGEQLVSDGGEPVNYDDGPVVVDTTPSDNNLWDLPAPIVANPGINDPPREVDDTTPSDNNFDLPPLLPPLPPPDKRSPVDWVNPVEAAKDKGIIQLGFVAVVIAGTVGAYLWGKN